MLPVVANYLGNAIPALSFLKNIFNGVTPVTPTGPTPPAPKSDLGVVAFLTADDTSLTVNQTTTARLWVQQSSPNDTNDNGIFSVAVDIDANSAGVVQSQVPVTILPDWRNSIPAANTGTATNTGGINEVTAGVSIGTAKTQGIGDPVEVFNFQVKAACPRHGHADAEEFHRQWLPGRHRLQEPDRQRGQLRLRYDHRDAVADAFEYPANHPGASHVPAPVFCVDRASHPVRNRGRPGLPAPDSRGTGPCRNNVVVALAAVVVAARPPFVVPPSGGSSPGTATPSRAKPVP